MKLNQLQSARTVPGRTGRMGIMAAMILLVTMLSSSLGVAGAKNSGPAAGGSTLFLTHNGRIVGQDPAPIEANDLHYVWSQTGCKGRYAFPYTYLYFTQNGAVIGKALAPCKSNDFEFSFDPKSGLILKATWTVNGVPMNPPILVPQGSNDVHVFLTGKTHLLKAWWTLNGQPIQGIPIPGFVNDMHWYGYPVPVGVTLGVPTFLYFTHNGKVVGSTPAPPNANDLHYIWSNGGCRGGFAYPYVKVFFTVNGQVIGKPVMAPCRANDFELAWNQGGCITSASFTVNGRVIANIPVIAGICVDDAHVYLSGKTHLLFAWWTFNGQPVSVIKIPGYVNDMHWYGYPTTTPGVVKGVTKDIYR